MPESHEPLAPYLAKIIPDKFAPVSPPLKWAGGKAQLLPQMRPYFPKHFAAYHEPFLGGGAVFFYLAPTRGCPSYLSDLNEELINFYKVLKDQTKELLALLRELHERYYACSSEEKKALFYTWRNADRSPDFALWSPVKRAARFFFLNKTAFNGLYRTNKKGYFNVPWGRYKRPPIHQPARLEQAASVLRLFARTLEVSSFEIVLDRAESGDFVYLDPPYAPLSPTASFTSYTKEKFGPEEQKRLAALCRELDRHNVMFLLSNSDLPWVRKLYTGFHIVTVQARRNINSKGDRRGPVSEILVYNYEPEVKHEP